MSDRISYGVPTAFDAYSVNGPVKSVNFWGGTSVIKRKYTRGCATPSTNGCERANIATIGMHGHGERTIPHRKLPI